MRYMTLLLANQIVDIFRGNDKFI